MANDTSKTNHRVLKILLAIQNRAIDVEFQLRVEGKINEADKLALQIDKLTQLINDLRGKILDDWLAKIPDLRNRLKTMSNEVQEAIDDIKDDIETAQRIVSLVGKVDQVIGMLAPLLL